VAGHKDGQIARSGADLCHRHSRLDAKRLDEALGVAGVVLSADVDGCRNEQQEDDKKSVSRVSHAVQTPERRLRFTCRRSRR
jgi:hypothetical protein